MGCASEMLDGVFGLGEVQDEGLRRALWQLGKELRRWHRPLAALLYYEAEKFGTEKVRESLASKSSTAYAASVQLPAVEDVVGELLTVGVPIKRPAAVAMNLARETEFLSTIFYQMSSNFRIEQGMASIYMDTAKAIEELRRAAKLASWGK